jgi:sulfonate transport system substrate-binding protein
VSTPTLTRRHALGGLAASAAVTAAMRPARAESPLLVRVGYAGIGVGNRPFVGGSAGATAQAGHYLEDEFANDPAVSVQWYFFRGAGPAVNEAIANNQLDVAYQGDLPSIVGRANGLETKIVFGGRSHGPIYLAVLPDSDMKSVDDLKGRKVAFQRGTNVELAVAKVLAAHGLTERDLKVITMDFVQAQAALASRDIEASFGESDLLELADKGVARIAYTTKGDNPAFGRQAHVLATEAFAAQHPDVTGRLVKAFVKAAHWSSLEENREALFELWAKSGIPAGTFRADFEGQALKYRNSPLLDDFLRDQYRIQAEQAKEHGLIRRDVDVSDWFDTRYLEAALKELHLEDFWPRLGLDGRPVGA